MKAEKSLVRKVPSILLTGVGVIALLWGSFCLLGGPDPGAGSGNDGLKFGIAFTMIGLAALFAARAAWVYLK